MIGRDYIGLIVFMGCVLGSAPLGAASFQLTPQQIDEAILAGGRSAGVEEFGREWQVVNSDGRSVSVVTPFHRLALIARNAALKDEPLRQRDVARALRESRDRLSFWVMLRGPREDFASRFQPVLTSRGKEIKASFVQNERTARREEDGRYLARCLFSFPVADLDPNGKITLVVRDHEGRNVARFSVDLAAMR